MPGRLIAIEGPSGVGKSSSARALARRLGAELIPEAYDLAAPRPSLSFRNPKELERLERALLRGEVERFRRAELARHQGRTVLLDTGFLGPLTYTVGVALEDPRYRPVAGRIAREVERLVRNGSLGLPTLILYLDLDEPSIERRSTDAPRTHPTRWRERHRAVGRWERRMWTWVFPRILPGRLGRVRAQGQVAEVIERLRRRLTRPGDRRLVPTPAALRVIRGIARLPSAGAPGTDRRLERR